MKRYFICGVPGVEPGYLVWDLYAYTPGPADPTNEGFKSVIPTNNSGQDRIRTCMYLDVIHISALASVSK